MFRALRFLNGFALALISCAALAQPPASPSAAQPANTQADTPADAPASSAAPVPHAPSGGAAPPLQACAVKAFDEYAAAMSAWERQRAEGVLAVRPEFKSAVIARSNAHNTALQRDGFRIHYLAANAPDSLDVQNSIASLRLFDWTQPEEQALRQAEPAYPAAAAAAEQAKTAADADPKSQALEAYFDESFTDNTGSAASRKLGDLLAQGDSALKYCREHYPTVPPPADCSDCAATPAAPPPASSPAAPGATPPARP
jgi:hypothetical protein